MDKKVKLPDTPSKLMRLAGLLLLGGSLSWLVITRSLVASLNQTDPKAALALRANDGEALTRLAAQALTPPPPTPAARAGKSSSDSSSSTRPAQASDEDIKAWARQALLDEPVNPQALRILGQLAEKSGDMEQAEKFMRAAAGLSLRESFALYWLMRRAYEKKAYATVLKYADALMRHRPKLVQYLLPMLAGLAENSHARPGLETLLAKNPPWRQRFMTSLPKAVTKARTPLNLLLALKTSPAPPTQEELNAYLHFLNRKNLFDLSYYTWLQFLPPDQLARAGFLFNGSFEMEPDRLPFNWTLPRGAGSLVSIRPRPDFAGRRALHVELTQGRVRFRGVTQTVVLAPGRYLFEGRYRGSLKGPRGLRWRITCLGGSRTLIGKTDMFLGQTREWKRFRTFFAVPHTSCPAQQVSLILDARTASERLVTGSAWYDDLKITPKFKSLN